MSVIRILPEAVANKIAAGEVVERPASLVKELLENSLDAGAEHLDVLVEAGGKQLIRVEDDGCGMTRDDAMLAFERHATSKIRSGDDLLGITTLGFRGEALPSIAAVSRLALSTRHASESSGTQLEIAGGKLRDVREIAREPGTSVEALDLFFNTPARRKFLKAESTELSHIASLVTHYALAFPEKSFRLGSLSNEILSVSRVTSFGERLYQVMGRQLFEQLIEIPASERTMPSSAAGDEIEESRRAKVWGFASRPEVQRFNRNQIFFFVNRRLVRDRVVLHALTESYRNILPSNTFPVALVFLDLPPAEVDVNVHPSKTEVRFRHSMFVHDLIRDTIRQALVSARPVPAFPMSRARVSAPEAVGEREIAEALADEPPQFGVPAADGQVTASVTTRARSFELAAPRVQPVTARLPLESPAWPGPAPSPFRPPENATQSVEAISGPAQTVAGEFPADLEPLGQIQESFIVAQNNEGLWIIDQHVAHERILFEKQLALRDRDRPEGQRLLLPIVVDLRPEQQAAFTTIAEELATQGFDVERFGQRAVAVKAAPADIRSEAVEKLLLEILDGVAQEARALSLDQLRGRIAATVACHAAIKINMPLDRARMTWLLQELARAECPMTCPHGRPTVLRFSVKDIWKAFKRI